MKAFNKALEERIIEANKDKTKWKKVLPDLADADIFVVANVADKPDGSGKQLNILMMSDGNGHEVIPFFTNPNRMSVLVTKDRKTFNVMRMNTIKFFQSIKGKTAVLNPRSTASKLFTPFEMNVLVMENLEKLQPVPRAVTVTEQDTKTPLADVVGSSADKSAVEEEK
jgi:hypothetical protein